MARCTCYVYLLSLCFTILAVPCSIPYGISTAFLLRLTIASLFFPADACCIRSVRFHIFGHLGVIRALPPSRQKLLHRALAEKPSENLGEVNRSLSLFLAEGHQSLSLTRLCFHFPQPNYDPLRFPLVLHTKIETINSGHRGPSFDITDHSAPLPTCQVSTS